MEESHQPTQPLENKFVKPKTRIPQQATKYSSYSDTMSIPKNSYTLKSFLESPCISKKERTRIWKTTTARVNDSTSYLNALKAKRRITENKRQMKAYLKQARENIERKQRYNQKNEFLDYQQPIRSHYSHIDENPSLKYSKSREVNSENKISLSKGISEGISLPKSYREDASKSFIEAEIKSTAVSCQERVVNKDMLNKTWPESHYNYYPNDSEMNAPIHQASENMDEVELPNNKSLLDELYEQNNRQLDDFMDSMNSLDY